MCSINPKIMKKLTDNHLITTADVLSLGFSRQVLSNYVKEGLLERVRHGIYMLPDTIHDDMYTLMLSSENIIFSHETALFLNHLSERTPFVHTVTFPSNKTVPGAIKNECICFYIKPELHGIGLCERINTFGNTVRCYDRERTICDFLRTRARCDEETVISAIKSFAFSQEKDLNRLAYYADLFKVKNELHKYMEVLL